MFVGVGCDVVGALASVVGAVAAIGRRTRIRGLAPKPLLLRAGEREEKGSDGPLIPLPLLPPLFSLLLPKLRLTSPLVAATGLVPPPPAAIRSTRAFSAAARRTEAAAREARARSWAWLSSAGREASTGARRGGEVGPSCPSTDPPPAVAAETGCTACSEGVEVGVGVGCAPAGWAVRRRLE